MKDGLGSAAVTRMAESLGDRGPGLPKETVSTVAATGLAARGVEYDEEVRMAKRDGGSEYRITLRKYEVVSRGGKGFQLFTRGAVEGAVYQEPEIPIFPED